MVQFMVKVVGFMLQFMVKVVGFMVSIGSRQPPEPAPLPGVAVQQSGRCRCYWWPAARYWG